MNVIMIKYLNLFNTNQSCTGALLELPMHPPQKLETSANASVSNLPPTQEPTTSDATRVKKLEFEGLQKEIMSFPSITFTRTMVRIIESSFKQLI